MDQDARKSFIATIVGLIKMRAQADGKPANRTYARKYMSTIRRDAVKRHSMTAREWSKIARLVVNKFPS